jgi:hypothetical protein
METDKGVWSWYHSEDGGLSGSVGTGQQVNIGFFAAKVNVVGNKVVYRGGDTGVAQLFEFKDTSFLIHKDRTAAGLAQRG